MRPPSRIEPGFWSEVGVYWKSHVRIMRTLISFPGLPSPGKEMRGAYHRQYFKIRVDVISLSNNLSYARIFVQLVPHVGVIK